MTQTNDPRKVKVIVELIDHTSKIAEAQDRGDLVERMANAKARISDPQIRVVIAGQLKQGKSQLLNSLLNVPVSRVGDDETTVLATMVSYGEQAAAKLIVAGADGGRAQCDRDPDRRYQERSAPPPRGRRPAGAPSRGHREQPSAQGWAGVRRHPGRRRSRSAASVGHARTAARRRCHADDQRHQPGVHRTRDDVHPSGIRNLSRSQRLSRPRPTCTRTGARSSRPTTRICSAPGCRSR